MKKTDLLRAFNVNIDLAVEAHELLRGDADTEVPGVSMEVDNLDHATVTTIKILNEQGVQEMGRPQGTYITIDVPEVHDNNYLTHQDITKTLSDELTELMSLSEDASILLVGLGNWNATPDALGPQVIDKSLVTRHLFNYTPVELQGKLRKVSAIAPGVLGITGIETAEIIRGIVEHVKPDLVIAIDALAAGSLERIGTSIQISDTGISPGSGVGNRRTGINEETLGCRVIAIGLPTVMNAAIIANNCLDSLLDELKTSPALFRLYKEFSPKVFEQILEKALYPYHNNLMVTPKEVDSLIQTTARIIAGALGMSLHPGISTEEYQMYMQ
ncbi:GPR endopeptidase [Desulfitobacterium dichloroeliminans LMG P-21439]|uniref:Germination protease n=1 Tax=Desulfitobacterium dichloroeliminans (strain LMG P-21439 / DCA1) TaxID=871963 RepID=L0FB18_DESDL|nr:GPR endopeptidase [Desulfitobacterium dichloroeliminans]AGA70133.1 GPR endopeptidase [Desulfitobacterium dichloroeliminans LMG P-21439]